VVLFLGQQAVSGWKVWVEVVHWDKS